MKEIILCLVFVLAIITTQESKSHKPDNCFLQQNGDLVCYSNDTGRKYIIKRV